MSKKTWIYICVGVAVVALTATYVLMQCSGTTTATGADTLAVDTTAVIDTLVADTAL